MRRIVADFMEWMSNLWTPWAAYRAMMSFRLIALDKQSGVRPVRVRGTWQRLMAKCLLWVMGQEAKSACRTEQLSGGVEAGIEGGIHSMQLLWHKHKQEEDWGFLLIDARNVFNEENRKEMLWAFWHEWPSGAHFTFN